MSSGGRSQHEEDDEMIIANRQKKGYDYIRKGLLGHGTYGSVHLFERQGALDPNPFSDLFFCDRNLSSGYCAIKTYKKMHGLHQLGVQTSSLREITLMLSIEHPNILKAHEVKSVKGNLQVVMDFHLELMDVYHDENILKEEKYKRLVCYQLAKGLAFLHRNYIFHRDLKPENVFISKEGVAKIGDFGFSKQFGFPNRKYTPYVCTKQYRAPELFFHTNYYTEKTDIWSLGCIFYTIYTGETLFYTENGSDISIITKIFSITGVPTKQTWPSYQQLPKYIEFQPFSKKSLAQLIGMQKDVSDFIELCLQLDPKKRPPASELLNHPFFKEGRQFYENGRLPVESLFEHKLSEALKKK